MPLKDFDLTRVLRNHHNTPQLRSMYLDMRTRYEYNAPYSNLLRLSEMIRSNALPPGQVITSLTLILSFDNESNRLQTGLSLLLPQLSSLKHLTVKSVPEQLFAWQYDYFSFAPLTVALSTASQTLQSLDLNFARHRVSGNDGWTIGPLRHFSRLQHLSIQEVFLLGKHDRVDVYPSLHSLLPLGLKTLHLTWTDAGRHRILPGMLYRFIDDSVEGSRSTMERILVLLDCVEPLLGRWLLAKHPDRLSMNPQRYNEVLSMPSLNERARQVGLRLKMETECSEKMQLIAAGRSHPYFGANLDYADRDLRFSRRGAIFPPHYHLQRSRLPSRPNPRSNVVHQRSIRTNIPRNP